MSTATIETRHRQRVRRALAHQCPRCRRAWALEIDLTGPCAVVRCRWCGEVRDPGGRP